MSDVKKFHLQPNSCILAEDATLIEAQVNKDTVVAFFDATKALGAVVQCNALQAKGLLIETLSKLKAAGCQQQSLTVKVVSNGECHDSGHDEVIILLKRFGLAPKATSSETSGIRRIRFTSNTGELLVKTAEAEEPSASDKPIRVLIVDDSASVRKVLRHLIELDPQFTVIGEADDPFAAAEFRKTQEPDVITLDMEMPGMTGLEYLREFMPVKPVPTIIVTQLNAAESDSVLLSLEAGAFDYMRKPSMTEMSGFTKALHAKLKAAAGSAARLKRHHQTPSVPTMTQPVDPARMKDSFIAIGASTGGTEAIRQVLMQLPHEIPPTFIVQHMAPTFIESFAKRLDTFCSFRVKQASQEERVLPNTAYVAPGGFQMRVVNEGGQLKIRLSEEDSATRFKPSVDCLFDSLSKLKRHSGVGIILSGMGSDGALGMLEMRKSGHGTIAQDERTSIVFGMPKAAIDLGGAEAISPLDEIAFSAVACINEKSAKSKAG